MGIVSKGLAALVILGIAWLLIDGYGDARYDAGWQAATTEQRQAAEEKAKAAASEKEESNRRLAALAAERDATMGELNRVKTEALHKDETYAKFRDISVHPVTRCRIWGLCDAKAPGGGDLRTPGSEPR